MPLGLIFERNEVPGRLTVSVRKFGLPLKLLCLAGARWAEQYIGLGILVVDNRSRLVLASFPKGDYRKFRGMCAVRETSCVVKPGSSRRGQEFGEGNSFCSRDNHAFGIEPLCESLETGQVWLARSALDFNCYKPPGAF